MKHSYIKTSYDGDLYVVDPEGQTIEELNMAGAFDYAKPPHFFSNMDDLNEFYGRSEEKRAAEVNHRYAQNYEPGGILPSY